MDSGPSWSEAAASPCCSANSAVMIGARCPEPRRPDTFRLYSAREVEPKRPALADLPVYLLPCSGDGRAYMWEPLVYPDTLKAVRCLEKGKKKVGDDNSAMIQKHDGEECGRRNLTTRMTSLVEET
ncbi:hypothetical protein EYF80_020962 [Liparis tanakae]|uniref:Uncharacterized protein n=1 Tax=Liparis tanakae TaxID=230148 RepID=A0A4Z2HUT1_9TELE|nr:hypothetical protein EYF80_020962 [Liparis tanakae]